MKAVLRKRLETLETRQTNLTIEQQYPGLDAALGRIHDALYAALPPTPGVTMPSPDYSHGVITTGYVSSREKVLELGRRLRAGTETQDDRHVLDALPADALAIAGMDARQFAITLLELDERI